MIKSVIGLAVPQHLGAHSVNDHPYEGSGLR